MASSGVLRKLPRLSFLSFDRRSRFPIHRTVAGHAHAPQSVGQMATGHQFNLRSIYQPIPAKISNQLIIELVFVATLRLNWVARNGISMMRSL